MHRIAQLPEFKLKGLFMDFRDDVTPYAQNCACGQCRKKMKLDQKRTIALRCLGIERRRHTSLNKDASPQIQMEGTAHEFER